MIEYKADYFFDLQVEEGTPEHAIEAMFETAFEEIYEAFWKARKKNKVENIFGGEISYVDKDSTDDDDFKLGMSE
jgi:hypothetical protein